MKILIIISLIFIINGCSREVHKHYVPVCRHHAILNAVTWTNETGERTMIASGPSLDVKGQWHAQAIVMDGMLIKHYLKFDGKKVYSSKQDNFIMMKFRSVDFYFNGLMNGLYGGHSSLD